VNEDWTTGHKSQLPISWKIRGSTTVSAGWKLLKVGSSNPGTLVLTVKPQVLERIRQDSESTES